MGTLTSVQYGLSSRVFLVQLASQVLSDLLVYLVTLYVSYFEVCLLYTPHAHTTS